MATELIMVGPFDKPTQTVSVIDEEMGWSDKRSLANIESYISNRCFPFSFLHHMEQLKRRFSFDSMLEILDAGCGKGMSLEKIKSLGATLNIAIQTTGIEKDQSKLPQQGQNLYEIDTLIVGSVQQAYIDEVLPKDRFHFILDYFGALHHDYRLKEGHYENCGETVLPIYQAILTLGGTALFATEDLRLKPQEMEKLFKKNGFIVLEKKESCALVEKIACS